MSTKVSVIVPSSNPGKCIRACLASLKKQTLKNIEIICVDSGSSDGTAEFLEEAAAGPVITLPGASYGALVNTGIENATGRFIAVIRPGDKAEPEMLEELYSVSSGMDMVMSGFYHTPAKDEPETLYTLPPRYTAISKFNPLLTFDTSLDQSELFSINCAVGSAIFSREFLEKYSIYFSEVEDSLYHDVSFSFKVWACASNVRLLSKAFLHCGWRGSETHSDMEASVYPVFDEYEEIRYFIREVFSEDITRTKVLSSIMMRLKYDSYLSCCQILPMQKCRKFARRASEEFQKDVESGYVIQKYFPSFDWNIFSTWVYDPESFADMIEKSRRPSLLSRLLKKKK